MTLRRVEDFLVNPVEFTNSWSFSGVAACSDAEKDALAREALNQKAKQWIIERQAAGQNLDFDHVELIANRNEGGETNQDVVGVRTHRCWGLAVGFVYVNV